ncbi:uncharacterized protein YdeI (YjbR/CyaY-like superfamily) [Mycetocola sp. BIGb0189]|uniref:YdeI/OmpD-associated family protein n=1 Tax=Mycetocola sp. BIGb0189 TaxID=2940604 RepID=UPI002167AC62|nr:YdeI/OmpD-associated family protein [Mycetocola sp. BIGb0189]MCS4275301.1 uncharacterized protein YdeI (YjbR/CyaY-like superfamily) [Mycetocola sp. BIGb0189]
MKTESTPPGPDGQLIVKDVLAWRTWLDANEETSDGVWLHLAKKGTVEPTTLTYGQALEEALCSGWIDGQKRSFNEATFLQRFTPRRRASMWSARNVGIIAELDTAGRIRPRGHAEVAAARADGRWDRAYAGSADVEIPEALALALAADPVIAAAFENLSASARYSILHPLITAATQKTRDARLARALAKLAEG